jgi:PEP-CTERM motif
MSLSDMKGLILRSLLLASMLILAGAGQSWGGILLTATAPIYTQDFNSLAINHATNVNATFTTLPTGWVFNETGNGTTYRAGNGSSGTGDTYSFGSNGSDDRAFGMIRSTTLSSTIGASFTNAEASRKITALDFAYIGEQWRLGRVGRTDRLDFQYSLNATSLNDVNGTWIDVDALDFTGPVVTGTLGSRDGNAAANKTGRSGQISSLLLASGSTFWIRWNDFDATGADDGLAIDDFRVIATFSRGNNIGIAAVPEPSSIALFTLVGLVGLVARRRKSN